jgi:hypothetical protein
MTYDSHPRAVRCRVLTQAGWISGTLHIPGHARLAEFLARDEPVLRLTSVTLPGQALVHEFFALERDAVIAIDAPGERPLADPHPVATTSHEVSWLLQGGVIQGTVDVPGELRLSDHVRRPHPLVVRGCTVFLRNAAGGTDAEPGVEALVLRAAATIGVSEK